jgi:hypothetical protein
VAKGCATCTAAHLGHSGNGVLLQDSSAGLTLLAADPVGPEWGALYVCPSCGAYRRSGVIEASKDYHSVWLPIENADDLKDFGPYLHRKALEDGTTEAEVVSRIVERSVWSLRET